MLDECISWVHVGPRHSHQLRPKMTENVDQTNCPLTNPVNIFGHNPIPFGDDMQLGMRRK